MLVHIIQISINGWESRVIGASSPIDNQDESAALVVSGFFRWLLHGENPLWVKTRRCCCCCYYHCCYYHGVAVKNHCCYCCVTIAVLVIAGVFQLTGLQGWLRLGPRTSQVGGQKSKAIRACKRLREWSFQMRKITVVCQGMWDS